jgi:hypothetical protein
MGVGIYQQQQQVQQQQEQQQQKLRALPTAVLSFPPQPSQTLTEPVHFACHGNVPLRYCSARPTAEPIIAALKSQGWGVEYFPCLEGGDFLLVIFKKKYHSGSNSVELKITLDEKLSLQFNAQLTRTSGLKYLAQVLYEVSQDAFRQVFSLQSPIPGEFQLRVSEESSRGVCWRDRVVTFPDKDGVLSELLSGRAPQLPALRNDSNWPQKSG